MRVEACTLAGGYARPIAYKSAQRNRINSQLKLTQKPIEQDTGKGMKQLSYVIGMSILGISSILLGTTGKMFSSVKI